MKNRPIDVTVVAGIMALSGLFIIASGVGLLAIGPPEPFEGGAVMGVLILNVSVVAITQVIGGGVTIFIAWLLWRLAPLGWWLLLLLCIYGFLNNGRGIYEGLFIVGLIGIGMNVLIVLWLFLRRKVFAKSPADDLA